MEALVRDRLESIITRINKVSKFTVRVHRDNIDRIQKTDNGVGTALHHAQNFSHSDYVEIDLKFNYKEKTDTESIGTIIKNWCRKFRTNPEEAENFELFRIEAEDEERNNHIESFDLLLDKEQTKITAIRKSKSRVLESDDLFLKIMTEYDNKFL